ncbi:hypothetical protein Acid345_2390 [Candidatus Koribacter versatilis Ellin345]|uniref:DUF4352 domain-containing protein n=1 Tax=Koribacter versatilis (strain Ellin345) TaxID=204669 RepID=Q1IP09_KORVE|nr:DUF4352 domain-containing protein [Candidatus Koribacter versatilis]ABF41391.1 hypothetical protein Acid345_2390 [Candidatus Koribacter versatilis Ellin345]
MPETNSATSKAQEPEYDAGHVPMTEEMDDAKHRLPPMAPVLIALAVIALVIGIAAYLFRAKPLANGTIKDVVAVELNTHDTSFVAINVRLNNISSDTLYIKAIKAEIVTPSGSFVDDAASATDYPRYLAAYPDLKSAVGEPLKVETKIAPGTSAEGSVLVTFPVTKEVFDKNTGLTVTIIPYDHPSINITKR